MRREADWERYLPLVLYAYRTAAHSSTGISPFQLMFGRQPKSAQFSQSLAFEPASYQAHLRSKLAELRDVVETNTTEAANLQKAFYDRHSSHRPFKQGTPVWLSLPTAHKLSPQWEGRWTVKEVKSDINVEITDGKRSKVVHINQLQPRLQPEPVPLQDIDSTNHCNRPQWNPPQIDHMVIPPDPPLPNRRYPIRNRQPPDWRAYVDNVTHITQLTLL